MSNILEKDFCEKELDYWANRKTALEKVDVHFNAPKKGCWGQPNPSNIIDGLSLASSYTKDRVFEKFIGKIIYDAISAEVTRWYNNDDIFIVMSIKAIDFLCWYLLEKCPGFSDPDYLRSLNISNKNIDLFFGSCNSSEYIIYSEQKSTKRIIEKINNDRVIGTYNNFIEAVDSVWGTRPENIQKCCEGKINSSYGYFWKYKYIYQDPKYKNE